MKLQRKKIIAREFLLLMLAIGIGLVMFSCTYLYNFYQRTKSQNTSIEITTKESIADSLAKPFDTKSKQHLLLYNKFMRNENVGPGYYSTFEKDSWEPLNKLALQDSIVAKYQKWDTKFKLILKDVGFNTPEELQGFIDKNRITAKDSSDYQKAENIRQEIKSFEFKKADYDFNVLQFRRQTEFGFWSFGISLIILFAIRYIFYAIKWSMRTLKQK